VRWVADATALADLVGELVGAGTFSLDTEFHRERSYFPHLALIQLGWTQSVANGASVALVDPLAVDVGPLGRLSGAREVVAHAAAQDLEVLERACGVLPRRVFDTQVAAGFLGFSTPSLALLSERVLGVQLPKADRLSDWRRRPLTPAQRDYAVADVAHLLVLAGRIEGQLGALGRLEWAREECARIHLVERAAPDPDTSWWRIKEVRALKGRARAIAQEVAAWRERTAMELDRPVRTVLPDLGVLVLATHPPGSVEEMRALRGLEGRVPRGVLGEGLLAAVERGVALPSSAVRLPPADDVERAARPAANLVAAWMGQLARDLRIDAPLLATRADLNAFLRGDPSSRLATGWRAELVGEPIRDLAEGRAALAVDGRGRLVLERRSRVGLRTTLPPVPDGPRPG